MKRKRASIGTQVEIVGVHHSPAATRGAGGLIGLRGRVIASALGDSFARVALEESDFSRWPGGVRRWVVAWDDLVPVAEALSCAERSGSYRAGTTGEGDSQQVHAIGPGDDSEGGRMLALCGEQVILMALGDWVLPFAPSLGRACPGCRDAV